MTRTMLPPVLAAGIFLFSATGVYASPSGGQIASGSGQIAQAGGNTTITQTTDKLGINWQNFNIAKGETVRFVQPGTNAVALNRVLGSNPSAIYGTLSANGKVFLINPNGILFAPGSQVNVGGIMASTMNMTDSDFQAGRYKLSGSGAGAVINQGSITAADGGYVALLGAQAKNEGIITANQGTVALAGGKAITLDFTGDGLLKLAVDQKVLDASAANSGLIQANGGQVVMTASTANTLAGTAVNNSGVIKAQSVASKNGIVILDGGTNGTVINSGTLDASGKNAGQTGGTIKVLGGKIELTGQAKLDASGEVGGGTILVGGNYQGKGTEPNATTTNVAAGVSLNANAITSGNGGKVVVWADDTTNFAGTITARGGSVSGDGGKVETSGKNTLSVTGAVNAGAAKGKGGSWLLDPTDYTIDTAAASSLKTALDGGTSVTVTSSSPGATTGNGDIHVNSALSWTGGGSLTLTASRNINVNAAITDGGAGNLTFTPGGAGNLMVGKYGAVSLTGTGGLSISGNPYILINDLAGWNGMGLSGYYALNADIAGVTAATGTPVTPFVGTLEGLGHEVTININSGGGYVGLFGRTETGALLRNVGVSGSISGTANRVGGLIGSNYGGNIINCYSLVDLNMTSATDIGGLVGMNAGIGIDTGAIINSYSAGTMASASSTNVGGLVGTNSGGGSIKNSYSTIAVDADSYYSGGLVGNNTGTVDNSYSTGDVTGDVYVGGLVGHSANAIRNSFSTGKVTGNPADSGGIVGEYASGPDLITNCFWNTTVNAGLNGVGEGTTSGAIGKTADEMKMAATFASWDQSVWKFYDGSTIPLLKSFLQSVTVTANSTSMIYNGTIYNGSAGVTYSSPVTLSGILAFTGASKDVGTYTVIPTGLFTDQQGYNITFASGTLTVTPAPLTVTATGVNKSYNGLTDADVTYGGWISGDNLSASGTAAFGDKNVGNSKAVNVSGINISGTDAGNYSLQNTIATTTANITPALLTVTATGVNKSYNGLTDADVTYGGWISGDNLSASGTAAFGDKNVGNSKAVNVSGINISGTDAGNYSLQNTIATTTANITPALLTVTATGVNKIYNGLTDASVTYGGWISGDNLSASGTEAFGDKNVGNNKAVNVSGINISGTDAGNYSLQNTIATTTANITPALLTVTATGVNKIYNGLTDASVTYGGWISGDNLSASGTAAFGDKNVGNNKAVNVSGINISGTDAGNYSLQNTTALANADITPASLTYTANSSNRLYGEANPVFSGTVIGFVNGETQTTATTGTLAFSSLADTVSPVGPYAINGSGLTANDGNYTFVQSLGNSSALTVHSIPVNPPSDNTPTNTLDVFKRILPSILQYFSSAFGSPSHAHSFIMSGNTAGIRGTGSSLYTIEGSGINIGTSSNINALLPANRLNNTVDPQLPVTGENTKKTE